MAFFFEFSKINICQNDIVENPLRTQALIKNQNLVSKKKEESKEKSRKKQIKTTFFTKS